MKLKLTLLFLAVAVAVSLFIFNSSFLKVSDPQGSALVIAELKTKDVIKFFDTNSWVDYQDQEIKFNVAEKLEKKAVYIHIWASWCAPCLNEIPELITYARKNKSRVQFIVVSLDESNEALVKFLKSFPELKDPMFIQVWDKNVVISRKLNADRLPMTVFIPADGGQLKTMRSVVDWRAI